MEIKNENPEDAFGYSKENMCDKCKKHKAVIEYKGSKYCTWYCGKKN